MAIDFPLRKISITEADLFSCKVWADQDWRYCGSWGQRHRSTWYCIRRQWKHQIRAERDFLFVETYQSPWRPPWSGQAERLWALRPGRTCFNLATAVRMNSIREIADCFIKAIDEKNIELHSLATHQYRITRHTNMLIIWYTANTTQLRDSLLMHWTMWTSLQPNSNLRTVTGTHCCIISGPLIHSTVLTAMTMPTPLPKPTPV